MTSRKFAGSLRDRGSRSHRAGDRGRHRRGITLLFVVSLIVLFLLMGTSFLLLAGQYRRSALLNARIGARIDDARSLVNRAFQDLLREPDLNNVHSPLRGHSLLGDQYGYGLVSRLRNPQLVTNTGAQIIRFELDLFLGAHPTDVAGENNQQFQRVIDGQVRRFNNATGLFDGQVLTFTRGVLAGQSVRILRQEVEIDTSVNPAVVQHRWIYVLLNPSESGVRFVVTPVANDVTRMPIAALEIPVAQLADGQPDVLINNRDFAGTGAGLFAGNPELGRAYVDIHQPALIAPPTAPPGTVPATLFPNRRGESALGLVTNYLWATYESLPGGSNSLATNEDYDALDFQNMFLAGWLTLPNGTRQFMPSFHRPALIRYNNAGVSPGVISPFRADAFVGGPASHYVDADGDGVPDNGYDVDTDGDGFNDSIWMDIGLPIQTDTKGRRLKPLVAYMVLDMDGRLNVNAHSNLAQAEFDANRFKSTFQTFLHTGAPDFGAGPGAPGLAVSFGQGYGPPEINLRPALNPGTATVELQNLLRGGLVGGNTVLGRYGSDQVPGAAAPARDLASAYRLFTYPDRNYAARGLLGNGFSSTMDIHGRLAWGVPDNYLTGLSTNPYNPGAATVPVTHALPTIDITGSSWGAPTEIGNSPYEFDFSRAPYLASPLAVDTPFSPKELESLLRRNDWDSAMLPPRLRLLLQGSFNNNSLHIERFLTTDSFEVPVPSAGVVQRLRDALINIGGLAANPLLGPTPAEERNIQTQVELMLAPEVIQGRKMDLNFPLGNGLDDNGNGVVDEPQEQAVGEVRPDVYGRAPVFGMDYDRDGVIGGTDFNARYIFARHLYVLVLAATQLVDRDGDGNVDLGDWFDYNGDGTVNLADLYDYRRDVAQWVANVVDFRDPDSICTGLEFDLNPWNGWQVDGNLATDEGIADRFVVWGTERPELLLTETVVMHDRRTQDTNDDPSGNDVAGGDDDLDSRLVPNASCFIELYNPWYRGQAVATGTNNTDIFPAELYGAAGVDLRRTSVVGNDPVWRIVASRWDDNPPGGGAAREVTLRTVYFVRPTNAALQANARFPDPAQTVGQVQPGQYAVIGSSGVVSGGSYTTYVGRRNTPTWDTELADTRRITLRPGASQVELRWFDDAANTWRTTTRSNVVAVAVDRVEDGSANGAPRSLGLTDPAGGYLPYAGANAQLNAVPDGFEFQDSMTNLPITRDEPVDRQANDRGGGNLDEWANFDKFPDTPGSVQVGGLRDDSLHPGVRRVRLERLANPLIGYDPATNPYVVVDQIGADVITFNGVTNADETDATNNLDLVLASFERSTNTNGVPPAVDANNNPMLLWRAEWRGRTYNPDNATFSAATAPFYYPAFTNTDQHRVSQNLVNSLGEPDLGYRQDPAAGGYVQRAFPWLTWNDRPFVSHLELASVPFGTSDTMLRDFTVHAPVGPSEYLSTANGSLRGSFHHLANFHADDYSRQPVAGNVPAVPGLHRMFEFVEVPSRFVGTQYELNPLVFADGTAISNQSDPIWIKQYLRPPYAWISNRREPGKVNLNTIWDAEIWAGVFGDYWGTTVPTTEWPAALINNWYQAFNFSRLAPNIPAANRALWPTDYPGVFRSPEKANFVPELTRTGLPTLPAQDALVLGSAQTTLMRAAAPTDPLGNRDPANARPLIEYRGAFPHASGIRNEYFRYDMRQRLGNLTTTRSSVFAVWVTVGFFEVDENDNPVEEYTGTRRQRGFFLVDRSIPVGFEPGKDHNTEKAIIASSIIE